MNPVEGVLLDVDGVLRRGLQLLPGAAEAVDWLRREGIPFLLVTNNSTRTPGEWVDLFRRMGLGLEADQILTSALVARQVLEAEAPPGTPVLALGGTGLQTALFADGRFLYREREVRYVVVGMDVTVTYRRLALAVAALGEGAELIATNPDPSFPLPGGRLAPGCGSLLAALETASGRAARILGKPHPPLFRAALARLNLPAERVVMVGDRFSTDIVGAKAVGLQALWVRSGVEEPPPPDVTPDGVLETVGELPAWIQARRGGAGVQ